MLNTFRKGNNFKRFLTQNYYLRKHFGKKVVKLSVNAGIGCPNRDGTKGYGGCIYCSDALSGDFSGNKSDTIPQQLEEQKNILSEKWNDCLYIAYFQAGSNTYAPISRLKKLYEEALSFQDIVGLSIATRADCITEEIACYLAELSEKTYLTVELGLQTVSDETAVRLNRCHTYSDFLKTYKMLSDKDIKVCIHIINGLPGETREMMLKTAEDVSRLKPHSVKIHMLHIIRNTALADEYMSCPFELMSLESYIATVCDQIELMHPDTIIERVTGDGKRSELIAPLWTTNKKAVINGIDKELVRREAWQGDHFYEK